MEWEEIGGWVGVVMYHCAD